ncbi:hypothetical protein PDG61_26415 [Mycolicibacterium sp. BiH015]|nr:hypothetical protein [Mycolicibacterium sp. BiH015]MDA2894469.1 hypothetical protein [Mycolicibacterium sp. BiH015]
MKQVDDLMLTGCGGVELAPHLGEATVYVITQFTELGAQFQEALAHRVQTRHRRLSEMAEFAPDLADVAIGAACEDTGRCRIVLRRPDSCSQVTHLIFEGLNPRFEIVGRHAPYIIAASR